MHADEVLRIYDDAYAQGYDERYLVREPWSRHVAEYQLEVLREVLEPGDRWLDVGCGTGWYLGQLDDVQRVGLDLSPAMLAEARRAAPDAMLVRGDLRDERPEWRGRFDVVSCLWFAYSYLDSLAEVRSLVEHMAAWLAPGGTCILQVCDSENVANGVRLPYEDPDVGIHGGQLFITNVEWTYVEPGGTRHEGLLAPHLQWTVDEFARWFDDVEVRRWPRYQPSWDRFKGIIATGPLATPAPVVPGTPVREVYPPSDHPLESHDEGTFYEPPPPERPGADDRAVNLGRRSWRRKVWYAAPEGVRRRARRAFDALPPTLRRRLDPRQVPPPDAGP